MTHAGAVASFVVPAHNAERTLEETVRSALVQTRPDIEVVVVDDGSRDCTAEVARALAAHDPRVRIFGQENAGPAVARNHGARQAAAPYLCFLDADDLVPPNKIEVQARILDRRPDVGVVYGGADMFTDVAPGVREVFPMSTCGRVLALGLRSGGLAFPSHSALVRRSAFEAVGGFRNVFVVEDTDFWTRLAVAEVEFEYESGTRVLYRRHPSARSTDLVSVVRGRLAILDWLLSEDRSLTPERRTVIIGRKRYLAHLLAGFLARRGHRWHARWAALSSLRWGIRPGHVFDVAGLVLRPSSLLDNVEASAVANLIVGSDGVS
jgi:glycosyltransferase involved in cell wall biosynthesis